MALMMSVSGVRGLIGETLTPTLVTELGCAFGSMLGPGSTVVIGRDSRPSGPMVGRAVVAGLLASGCRVVILGVATTPAVAFMVRQLNADGGIVITASHNPIIWNGIKFLTNEGLAPPPERAKQLFDRYHAKQFNLVDVDRIGAVTRDDTAAAVHVDAVLKTVDAGAIANRRFRVVLDSVNGAGGAEGRLLLDKLGVEVVHINGEPTGRFAHTPEPLAENLTELCDVVKRENAAAGFAQDPDADRLAIVDEKGNYIGEEYTLALAAKHMFATHPGPAAANMSTSRMVDALAEQAGKPCVVHRSAVGEANVVAAMKAHQCVIGGEGNGGVIDPRVVPVRDSLVAMALTLQLMTDTGKTLSALVAEIPSFVMIKRKFECSKDRIGRVIDAVKTAFKDAKLNDSDGVRVDLAEGWVHVRGRITEARICIIDRADISDAAEQHIAKVQTIADGVS